jgi:flagellar basal-body rod modification protein FlgD
MSTVGLDNVLATQTTANAATMASTSTKAVTSEKDMFLNLLVKQLQYQDPLNPVENTEFASQLAQFSSLEALTSVKQSMDDMSKVQNSMNSMQAVSFIGKKVNANGNTIAYTGADSSITFNLAGNAADAVVKIYNSSGTSVRTLDMKNLLKGDAACTWDGKNDSGETLGSGTYYFTVSAMDYSGKAVASTTSTNGTVSGVRYDNGTIYLEVGDKEVSLADVTKISN